MTEYGLEYWSWILSPGGGIGRHKGLKSLEGDFVPVQVRPWVPKNK